jgi:class 3 adenylate cyclase
VSRDVVSGYAVASDGAYIAYQTLGDGPVDLVWQFDWFGNVDAIWEVPFLRDWFEGLAKFSRVILHDRRATGASSRNVPAPNLETRVSDLLTVLAAVGADRPVVLAGQYEGGAPNVLLAGTYPERVHSLVWHQPLGRSTWTPDYPWGVRPEYVEAEARATAVWGTTEYGRRFIEYSVGDPNELGHDDAVQIGRLSRQMCTPDTARELVEIWYQTDVRGALPAVKVPALVTTDTDSSEDVEETTYVASLMPRATVERVGGGFRLGRDHLDAVRRFLGVQSPRPSLESVLTTVLFTDIVGSTQTQAALGDRGWKLVVERHHRIARDALETWRGVENDTAGDGFFATFDGPARAIHCALEITERVRELDIEIRSGVHTGECELIDGKHGGISVAIGARISALAPASEVLVSQTVKDLVAGSGLTFKAAGEHELKGVPDRWQIYAVTSRPE